MVILQFLIPFLTLIISWITGGMATLLMQSAAVVIIVAVAAKAMAGEFGLHIQ